jgi:hypothetical protein
MADTDKRELVEAAQEAILKRLIQTAPATNGDVTLKLAKAYAILGGSLAPVSAYDDADLAVI